MCVFSLTGDLPDWEQVRLGRTGVCIESFVRTYVQDEESFITQNRVKLQEDVCYRWLIVY